MHKIKRFMEIRQHQVQRDWPCRYFIREGGNVGVWMVDGGWGNEWASD